MRTIEEVSARLGVILGGGRDPASIVNDCNALHAELLTYVTPVKAAIPEVEEVVYG